MSAIEIARLYFNLSNKSDLEEIEKLFDDSTQYSSQNTGTYTGRAEIMAMQRSFHAKFEALHWTVNKVEEVSPGKIIFDYDFAGVLPGGEKVSSSGTEHIDVRGGIITKIEIRNMT